MPLFIRSRLGIQLTPQGRSLFSDFQNILNLISKIMGQPQKIQYKIGCHPSVGMFILSRFLKKINHVQAYWNLSIINDISSEINKKVALGEIDFGIIMNPLPIKSLITKMIGEDLVTVWKSKNHYRERLIFNPSAVSSSIILNQWKHDPMERIEVCNHELIANLVASGAGYGILPSRVIKAQNLDLIQVPNTGVFYDKLAVVCFPETLKSKEGKLIFEALKKSFIK